MTRRQLADVVVAVLIAAFLVAVILLAGCSSASEPRPPLPPCSSAGCWTEIPIGPDGALLRVHYPDCKRLNVDSLVAGGWTVRKDCP